MSEQRLPVGTIVVDSDDSEAGFILGEAANGEYMMAWFCDIESGSYDPEEFGVEDAPHEPRFVVLDNPKQSVPSRLEDFVDVLSPEKLTHVFVWIWLDSGVPNVNVYQDIDDLTANAPISQEIAMRAVSEPGEAIEIDNGEKQQWLRFVLKG